MLAHLFQRSCLPSSTATNIICGGILILGIVMAILGVYWGRKK